MRRPTSYTFHSVWRLAAAPAAVYQVLCHVESYPAWWPEVRSMRRLDERRFDTVCKSLLPYELRFVTEQAFADPTEASWRRACPAISKAAPAGRLPPTAPVPPSPTTRRF